MFETKLHDWAALRGGVGTVLLRCKSGMQRAPDTKVGQGLDFPAPVRCELPPVPPVPAKYRGPRKPAWIGPCPCAPCVPYRKTACRSRAASIAALFVAGLQVFMVNDPSPHPPIKVLPVTFGTRVIRTTSRMCSPVEKLGIQRYRLCAMRGLMARDTLQAGTSPYALPP
jgi:hypothetical protein